MKLNSQCLGRGCAKQLAPSAVVLIAVLSVICDTIDEHNTYATTEYCIRMDYTKKNSQSNHSKCKPNCTFP